MTAPGGHNCHKARRGEAGLIAGTWGGKDCNLVMGVAAGAPALSLMGHQTGAQEREWTQMGNGLCTSVVCSSEARPPPPVWQPSSRLPSLVWPCHCYRVLSDHNLGPLHSQGGCSVNINNSMKKKKTGKKIHLFWCKETLQFSFFSILHISVHFS